MLVVDLSYSMSQEDMESNGEYIDRLTAVKRVLGDFISKREGEDAGTRRGGLRGREGKRGKVRGAKGG